MLVDQLFDCGGPPQAGCSSRRKQRYKPNRPRRAVEAILKSRKIATVETEQPRLRGRRLMPARRNQHSHRRNREASSLAAHDDPASRFAKTSGNRIDTTTTTAENHSSSVLASRGLQLHCLARQA